MIDLKKIAIIHLMVIICLVIKILFNDSKDIQASRSELMNINLKMDEIENFRPNDKRVWIEEFKKLATKYGTDKAISHDYQNMYGTLLWPIRDENVSLLEIGLGCTMGYGPGKSIPIWREFLPKVKVSILEYDAKCAEPFRSNVEQLFIGDQSDFEVLKKVANGGPYDVIVDDGGHQVIHQINSLIGLWPALKNGGMFFIEDLYLYHVKGFNDPQQSTFNWIQKLSFLLVNHIPNWDKPNIIPHNMTFSKEIEEIYKTLFSVNCFHRACVLTKK